ncbi:MAG: DUF1232 domain-containing protein [Chitinophagales bacterium]
MNSFFDRALKKAELFIEDRKYITRLLDAAFSKMGNFTGSLYDVQDHLLALLRMLSSWVKRDYKDISPKALVALLAAVIYFVNPIDLISDFIPFFGMLDDITVLTYVITTFNVEIERFMDWEKTQSAN